MSQWNKFQKQWGGMGLSTRQIAGMYRQQQRGGSTSSGAAVKYDYGDGDTDVVDFGSVQAAVKGGKKVVERLIPELNKIHSNDIHQFRLKVWKKYLGNKGQAMTTASLKRELTSELPLKVQVLVNGKVDAVATQQVNQHIKSEVQKAYKMLQL